MKNVFIRVLIIIIEQIIRVKLYLSWKKFSLEIKIPKKQEGLRKIEPKKSEDGSKNIPKRKKYIYKFL